MKQLSILIQIPSLLISLLLSNTAFANSNTILNEEFIRYSPESPSNSGHTVIEECEGTFDGNDYNDQPPATAKLQSIQFGDRSIVKVILKNGRPNTLYSVWLRVKGIDQDGNSFGGNPLTNGGATPLAPGSSLDELEKNSPWNSVGNAALENGFNTNDNGHGQLEVRLDFPLHGGNYPFNKIPSASLENIRNLKNSVATRL